MDYFIAISIYTVFLEVTGGNKERRRTYYNIRGGEGILISCPAIWRRSNDLLN
jgi:hypothetical protein